MQIHLLILSNFFACLSAPYKIYNYKHHDNMVVLTLLKITQEILKDVINIQNIFLLVW